MAKKIILLILAAFAAVNCGGNGGHGSAPPAGQQYSAPVDFGTKQTGQLNLNVDGTEVDGTLVCNEPPIQPMGRGLESLLPAGSRQISGTFTAPRSFTVEGTMPNPTRQFTIEGLLPTETEAGSYTLTIGEETVEGAIPFPGEPIAAMVMNPTSVKVDKGQAATFQVKVLNKPAGSDLVYRWFTSAPVAYIVDDIEDKEGQDIETQNDQVKVQTGPADQGKLNLFVHVYAVKNGVKTFIGESKGVVELEDVVTPTPTWVMESNPSPFDPTQNVDAYFWEFPVIPGAKDYVITRKNPAGQTLQVYRMLQGDVEATAVTEIPYLSGIHPIPPAIPVHDELTGVVRDNFIRRGNSIRMLVVWGNGFDPNIYKNGSSISVVVRY